MRIGDPNRSRYLYDFELEPGYQLDLSLVVGIDAEPMPERPRAEPMPDADPERPVPYETDGVLVGVGQVTGSQQDLGELQASLAEATVAVVGAGDVARIHAGFDVDDLRDRTSFAEGGRASFFQVGRTGFFLNFSPQAPGYGREPGVPGDADAPVLNRVLIDGLGSADRNLGLAGLPLGPDANRDASAPFINAFPRPDCARFRFYISIGRLPDRLAPPPPANACPRLLFARISVQMQKGPQVTTHTYADSPYRDFGVFPEGLRLPPQQDLDNRFTYLPLCARVGELGILAGGFSNRAADAPGARIVVEDIQARYYRRFDPVVGPAGNQWIRTVV